MDRDDVIKRLERACQLVWNGEHCDIMDADDALTVSYAITDAIAMLKAQDPRVMKIGEVLSWMNSDRVTREPIVIEIRSGVCAWIIDDEVRELPGEADLSSDLYGKTWRCWTSRPTDEQREAVKWE